MEYFSRLVNRDYPLPQDFVPEDLVPCDFPFLASGDEEKRLLNARAAASAKRLVEYGKSVSYTHLDVYKRQPYKNQCNHT